MSEECCCLTTVFTGIAGLIAIAYIIRQYLIKSCESKARLDGKVAIVTGSNTGCGKWTAIDLAKRGARVIMACRSVERGEAALMEVKKISGSNDVYFMQLDLASLESVKRFAESFLKEYSQLHILVNNAAIMMNPFTKTEDGFESQFGVNHLGHFALTNLLLKRIKASAPARIINVSSRAHLMGVINFDDISSEKSYSQFGAYSRSKLANVLFTNELERKLKGTDITSYSLHPGLVASELGRQTLVNRFFYSLLTPFERTCEQGAQTTVYCAVQEGLEKDSGKYFANCGISTPNSVVHDEGIAKKLWELSENMTGVKFEL